MKELPARRKPQADPPQSQNDNVLPRWNLDHLYTSLDADALAEDMERVESLVHDFKEAYEDGVARLSGAELAVAIAEYEKIESLRHKIYSYTFLLEQQDSTNIPKTESLRKWLTETGDETGFFEGEIGEMKEAELLTKLGTSELAVYAPWLAGIRADRNFVLSDGVEVMSRDLNAASVDALNRLYDQTMANIRIEFKGEKLSFEELSGKVSLPGTSLQDRIEAREKIAQALKENSGRVAFIYNAIIKSKSIDADWRKYERPDEDVNISNRVSAETVDTMLETVKASYARLSNRFYRWKAEQHGVEFMPREMVPAPLPDEPKGADKTYTFGAAQKLVLQAFHRFSPKFSALAKKFFDGGYIDADPREGKNTGGFAMPTGPDNFPYILINFTGKTEDVVSALGHELGHGVHQALAEKARGNFLSEMPTTVAETASIFAEMLVFEELLKGEKDPARRKKLLMEKTENMLDNSLRQISYYDFEMRVHAEAKKGDVGVERICDIWTETQKAYFGPAVETDECDRYRWMTVPHFFDTPFYVYSYSFAQVTVSGLFQLYKQAEQESPEARDDFIKNYIGLLETGITKNMHEMFRPFGLDPETPEFWEKGLSLMDRYLDELSSPEKAPEEKLQDKFSKAKGKPAVKNPQSPKSRRGPAR